MYGDPAGLAFDIEVAQCVTCTHKNFRPDSNQQPIDGYYMCGDIESKLILDGEWPDEIAEDEFGQAYCTKYRYEVLDEESAPEQEKLF